MGVLYSLVSISSKLNSHLVCLILPGLAKALCFGGPCYSGTPAEGVGYLLHAKNQKIIRKQPVGFSLIVSDESQTFSVPEDTVAEPRTTHFKQSKNIHGPGNLTRIILEFEVV